MTETKNWQTAGALPRRQALESKTELAEAKTSVSRARSRLQFLEADAQLQRAYSDLQVAQSRMNLSDGTYQARLKQLGAQPNPDGTVTITAPISGVIADQDTTLGESGEDAGKPIVTILNHRNVLVAANVYEKDIDSVQLGQTVQVKVNSLPNRSFKGRVSLIDSVVAGDNQVVPVKAELDNPDGLLKSGMFATLEVFTNRTAKALLVIPQSAVVETNNQETIVFIQNGNAFQPVKVTLGQTSGDKVEVKRGLFAEDLVVTQRAPQLYAQSLRGEPHETSDGHSSTEEIATTPSTLPFPWWVGLGAGGAIIAGTFWAGTFWASRRKQYQPVVNHQQNSHPVIAPITDINAVGKPPDPQPSSEVHS